MMKHNYNLFFVLVDRFVDSFSNSKILIIKTTNLLEELCGKVVLTC